MSNVIYVDFVNKKVIPTPAEIEPTPDQITVDKMQAFNHLLDNGIVRVVTNGYMPGVSLPEHTKQHHVILDWSRKFDIRDFTINTTGISGTLSFKGEPHLVVIPWGAVISMWSLSDPANSKLDWQGIS